MFQKLKLIKIKSLKLLFTEKNVFIDKYYFTCIKNLIIMQNNTLSDDFRTCKSASVPLQFKLIMQWEKQLYNKI